jgi:hypothetical protein
MLAFALFALAVLVILWRGRRKAVIERGQWRVGAGLLSTATLMGAVFVSIRGDWPLGLGLLALGLGLLFAARSSRLGPSAAKVDAQRPSVEEARSVLGVKATASETEIRAAYARLMRMAHPDRGGTTGLAAQLNAARDRLLKS